MAWFKDNLSNQKKCLAEQIEAPISNLAKLCEYDWQSAARVTELLAQEFHQVAHCLKLYAMNTDYIQIGASIIQNEVDMDANGFNHAAQPYISGDLPFRGLVLTSAYTGYESKPLITVIQAVNHTGHLLGFVAADFDLRDLPANTISANTIPSTGNNLKGIHQNGRLHFYKSESKVK